MEQVDIIVVGAGVVGLAVAAELTQRLPDASIIVMEKHGQFGWETSSRNSEVIHAGMYYPTGSLKAKVCIDGNPRLYEFCAKYNIPHQRIGKLIIAREESEIPSIEAILKQGQINGVSGLEMIDKAKVASLEPNINAVAAVYSPNTGIIDSHKLMAKLESMAKQGGTMVAYHHEVKNVQYTKDQYEVEYIDSDGNEESLACRWLINCAGLYADHIAASLGIDVEAAGYKIYPVKGEYFSLPVGKSSLLFHLVYPPPLKALKGLGIHVTKTLDGRARLGPSAFYVDKIDYDVDPNNAASFYQAAKTYLPFLDPEDLQADMSGIRAKIQSPNAPIADFVIRHEVDRGLPRFINLVGIESPGLTACLSIANMVVDMVADFKE